MLDQSNTLWQFSTAGTIKFGRGCSLEVAEELIRLKKSRPLLVVDPIVLSLPKVRDLLNLLRSRGFSPSIFDRCLPEPPLEVAIEAADTALASGADSVVGIGGGSNLDVAKITATVMRHGGSPTDYFGFDAIPGPISPLIAIPTTAGTGSEVSHSAVLSDAVAGIKVSTLSRWLRPAVALVDPALTDSCPPSVTAHSGIDALVHAIEALTNRDFSLMVGVDPQARAYEGSYPLTRLLAAEAIRLIGSSLVQAYREPAHEAARDNMALAALLAGMAFSNSGVALVHALEYPIGVLTHCSHGEGNGLLLPHVMRFNLPACTSRMAEIAGWLGKNTSGQNEAAAAELAVAAVTELQSAIGIRTHLSQLGMTADKIPGVAAKAFQIKRLMDVNPRRPSEDDLVRILQAAM
jgi:alcohol dehydrogenase